MKKYSIIILIFASILGCRPSELLLSSSERLTLKQWELVSHESGGSYKDWESNGFVLYKAKEWVSSGYPRFTLQDAIAWRNINVSVGGAFRWQQMGLAPSEASQWIETGVPNATTAQQLLSSDPAFTLQDAIAWRKFDIHVSDAAEWQKNGFTPQDAIAWRNINIKLDEATEWQKNGFAPLEAKQWIEIGVNDPSFAKQWVDAKIPIDEAEKWGEISLSAIFDAIENDITHSLYRSYKKADDHLGVYDIIRLRKKGISPAQVKELISYMGDSNFRLLIIRAERSINVSSLKKQCKKIESSSLGDTPYYQAKNKCYIESIEVTQVLSKSDGFGRLLSGYGERFLNINHSNLMEREYSGIVKVTGVSKVELLSGKSTLANDVKIIKAF